MLKSKNSFIAVAVIVSLFFSAGLNFYNIKNKGIFYYDEGYYLLTAQFYRSIAINSPHILRELKAQKALQDIYDEYVEGTFLSTPKPLHGIIVAFFGLWGGIKDYTGALASGFLGVLSVLLVFFIGRRFFNAETGVFAAAILATSKYFVLYCRSGLAEITPTFFFLAALYVYSLSFNGEKKNRLLAASGVLLGLAVACNYRWLLLMPLFVLFELFRAVFNRRHGQTPEEKSLARLIVRQVALVVKRSALIFIPLFLILFVFQIPYWIIEIFRPLPPEVMSYFNMFFGKYQRQAAAMASTFHPQTRFFEFIWLLFNPMVFVLLFIGLFFSIKKLDLNKFIVCAIFLLPFGLFSLLQRGDNPRALSSVLPFIALLAALGAEGSIRFVAAKLKKYSFPSAALSAVFLAAIWVAGIINTYPLLKLQSGYKEAIEFLKSAPGGSKHFSSMWPISAFYLGRANSYYPFPSDFRELETSRKEGINYMLVHFEDHNYLSDFTAKIIKITEPVKQIENGDMLDYILFAEDNHSDKDRLKKMLKNANNQNIQIFETGSLSKRR